MRAAVLCLVLLVLCVLPATAAVTERIHTLKDIAALVGTDAAQHDFDRMMDMTWALGLYFPLPVAVYISGDWLDIAEYRKLPINLAYYVRDGKVMGLACYHASADEASTFERLDQDAQRAIFDKFSAALSAELGLPLQTDPMLSPLHPFVDAPDGRRYMVAWNPDETCAIRVGTPAFFKAIEEADLLRLTADIFPGYPSADWLDLEQYRQPQASQAVTLGPENFPSGDASADPVIQAAMAALAAVPDNGAQFSPAQVKARLGQPAKTAGRADMSYMLDLAGAQAFSERGILQHAGVSYPVTLVEFSRDGTCEGVRLILQPADGQADLDDFYALNAVVMEQCDLGYAPYYVDEFFELSGQDSAGHVWRNFWLLGGYLYLEVATLEFDAALREAAQAEGQLPDSADD
jgi:hypothetical protein